MEIIKTLLFETWFLTAEMAPYLLLGFILAGLLKVLFSENFVKKHLGQRGFRQTIRAVALGVPLPICSCGVIPVAAGLRRQGARRGAVAAFTSATPQTGVDSILATAGMLGWLFSLVRVVIAFITGIITGMLVDKFGDKDLEDFQKENDEVEDEHSHCCSDESSSSPCCSEEEKDTEGSLTSRLPKGIKFGLITLPRDIGWALAIGIVLAGLISTFSPDDLFTNIPGSLATAYVVMTLISLPLYVCATGSIPMAVAFIQAGASPGSVLIFLIAGPATNVATVSALVNLIGKRSTILYILAIVVVSWTSAFILDVTGISLIVEKMVHSHEEGLHWFKHLSAILLILILGYSYLEPHLGQKETESGCCGDDGEESDDCHHETKEKSCCSK